MDVNDEEENEMKCCRLTYIMCLVSLFHIQLLCDMEHLFVVLVFLFYKLESVLCVFSLFSFSSLLSSSSILKRG